MSLALVCFSLYKLDTETEVYTCTRTHCITRRERSVLAAPVMERTVRVFECACVARGAALTSPRLTANPLPEWECRAGVLLVDGFLWLRVLSLLSLFNINDCGVFFSFTHTHTHTHTHTLTDVPTRRINSIMIAHVVLVFFFFSDTYNSVWVTMTEPDRVRPTLPGTLFSVSL